jgi:hypothetical protein
LAISRTLSARYKKGHERLTDFRQIETCCLPCCAHRTVLLELLDHAVEVGVAGAKAPCEPVSTALGYPLAVSDNLELTVLTRRNDGFNVQAILNEGHETRDLGFIVLSRRAVNDLDLHLFSNLLRPAAQSIPRAM